MNLTIKNHKEEEVEMVVRYENYYGDNMNIKWNDSNVESLEKLSARKYRVILHLKPNKEVTLKWS